MPEPRFRDLFSRDSTSYARFRPRYPSALFEWLAALPERRALAWDCGTGSGQAAVPLTSHFDRVVGTDASMAQLRAAARAPGLSYLACPAEQTALRGGMVDLVTVAQAFHWLDHERFFAEVGRVIGPGGALAVIGYARISADPEVERAVHRFQDETVGPWWPPERKLVDARYRGIGIPIQELPDPGFRIQAELELAELLGYVGTWSAVELYRERLGRDPVPALKAELEPVWGDPGQPRPISWPLFVRAGKWAG